MTVKEIIFATSLGNRLRHSIDIYDRNDIVARFDENDHIGDLGCSNQFLERDVIKFYFKKETLIINLKALKSS